jgi:hypothetical protein
LELLEVSDKMLELVNLSNFSSDMEMIHNSPACLEAFLNHHHLDGLEMMFCAPWDRHVHRREWIQGVHLRFWPNWLDFWRGDRKALLREFPNEAAIAAYYGGQTQEAWLAVYRENIRLAVQSGAKYLVYHVSHARLSELYNWKFNASDREVIEATIEVVNELASEIPENVTLLFENLWWPGLTLTDSKQVPFLLEGVRHANVGIMLDTGHLMNTNSRLRTQEEGVAYILHILSQLGDNKRYVKGIHLHHSLSGEYIDNTRNEEASSDLTIEQIMSHVMKIDQHLPFSTSEARRIVDYVQPEYLVHEFLNTSLNGWVNNLLCQQQALKSGID